MKNKRERIIWIELLRVFACIGVIALHAGSHHFRDIPIDTSVWKISNFFHGITRFAVACFVMISGSLYLSGERHWSLKKLWKNNILHIAIAYVFWTAFYSVYKILTQEAMTRSIGYYVKKFLVNFSKSYYHLWYLPMLLGLLIVTPLLWEIVNSKNGKQWEEYIIIMYMIFHIFPYTLNYFALPYKEHIMKLVNTVSPDVVTGYIGYFVVGHYLTNYVIPRSIEYLIYVLGVISITAGIILCQIASLRTGNAVQSYYENYTFAAFFWSIAIFLFFKNYISRIKWSESAKDKICYLGNCTFGIYLIHAFMRDCLERIGIESMMISNTFIAILIVIALIFTLSFGAVVIIKKIPVLKKWIV